MSEVYEMNIDEIEKYIIGKKIKDMSLEEIKQFIATQGNTIILNHHIYEKQQKEIERLNNIINEIKDYFEDLEIFAPSRDIKYDILDIIEGSDKE